MRCPGFAALRRAGQSIRNRFVRGAVILLYHRVSRLDTDPQLLCVTPQHFSEHLEILRKEYSPIGLRTLSQAHRRRDLSKRAVAVTFDDGYHDNLVNAKPLLEQQDIPATVFVATGLVGRMRECWWDELDRLLLQPGILPQSLSLTVHGRSYSWSLGDGASYGEDTYERHRAWNVRNKTLLGSRQALYTKIHSVIRSLTDEQQARLMDKLLAWAGLQRIVRSTHRTLNADELLRLADGGLVEIGAHTVTHPVLAALPLSAQHAEIHGSKAQLDGILGRPVTTFAYPYGLHSDYSADTVASVKHAGFECATSSLEDNVWRRSDIFQLPRRIVFDWDGDEFAKKMRQWLGG